MIARAKRRRVRTCARPSRRWRPPCRPSSARSTGAAGLFGDQGGRRARSMTWPAPARKRRAGRPHGDRPFGPCRGEVPDADHIPTLEIECGKGTYVRAIARDLSEMLGACGHVSDLRRTRVGRFTEQSAVTLEFLLRNEGSKARQSELLPLVETALDDIPSCRRDRRGRRFPTGEAGTRDRSRSPTGGITVKAFRLKPGSRTVSGHGGRIGRRPREPARAGSNPRGSFISTRAEIDRCRLRPNARLR